MAKKPVIVLDTNVFVSGLISPKGVPGAVLLRFRQGDFDIVTSQAQIREIREVLKRPSLARAQPKGMTKEVLRFFMAFKKLTRVFDPSAFSAEETAEYCVRSRPSIRAQLSEPCW